MEELLKKLSQDERFHDLVRELYNPVDIRIPVNVRGKTYDVIAKKDWKLVVPHGEEELSRETLLGALDETGAFWKVTRKHGKIVGFMNAKKTIPARTVVLNDDVTIEAPAWS